MKKILIAFLFLSSAAGAETIKFIDNDWNKARTEAAGTGKYLFVDAYTDWCYWCKVMDKETFPDKEVTAFVSANFVSLKLEMEHKYGVNVAMKYGVSAFPSFLIFTPDGKLVRRITGYAEPVAFLEELKKTLNKNDYPPLPGISTSVEVDFPEFYKKTFAAYDKKVTAEAAEVNGFLAKQQDLFSEISYRVLLRFASALNDTNRNFLLENRAKYETLFGKSEIDDAVMSMANKMLANAIKDKSETALRNLLGFIQKHYLGYNANIKSNFVINYCKGVEDWKNMAIQVDKFIERNGYEGGSLNDWSWTVYEKCDDAEVIKKAVGWMKPVIEKQPEYAPMDTYAALLYKAGNYTEAKTFAQKAIELGKAAGDKTEETEALLKKIEAAK